MGTFFFPNRVDDTRVPCFTAPPPPTFRLQVDNLRWVLRLTFSLRGFFFFLGSPRVIFPLSIFFPPCLKPITLPLHVPPPPPTGRFPVMVLEDNCFFSTCLSRFRLRNWLLRHSFVRRPPYPPNSTSLCCARPFLLQNPGVLPVDMKNRLRPPPLRLTPWLTCSGSFRCSFLFRGVLYLSPLSS